MKVKQFLKKFWWAASDCNLYIRSDLKAKFELIPISQIREPDADLYPELGLTVQSFRLKDGKLYIEAR